MFGTAGQATVDNIIRHMCFAFWINMATDTRWEHLILNASPRQERLRERVSMLSLPVYCLSC